MGEYSELFVAFDVAKKKHAVAIAEGGRRGEIRFVGEIENSPATIERLIKKLAGDTSACMSASKQVRPVMSCIGRFWRWVMTAWWLPQP